MTTAEIPTLARDRAFETLYRRYAKDVYRYALALLRNPADAEDVTQTTFMNAYRAYRRGDRIDKPHNWLIKIAHNAARTRYARAARRVREVPLEDHLEQIVVPEEERADVYAVLDALGRLPLNQRAALVMRELEGRTYAEIGDTLGVSVAAVETLIFRGRRSLRVKASAVRVLGVVQLPTSLLQFLDAGGGAVAGGGAAAGTGFLGKAAVAVIAGVVATGIPGEHNGGVAAAGEAPSSVSAGATAQPASVGRLGDARLAGPSRARPEAGVGGGATRRRAPVDDVGPLAASVGAAPSKANAPSSAATSSPQSTATTALSATTQTLTSTIQPVTDALPTVPSLPVSQPQLPPPPVQLPPPPQLPGLPLP